MCTVMIVLSNNFSEGFTFKFFLLIIRFIQKVSPNIKIMVRIFSQILTAGNTCWFQQRFVCAVFPLHGKPLFLGAGLIHSRLRVFVSDAQEDHELQQLHAPWVGPAEERTKKKLNNQIRLFGFESFIKNHLKCLVYVLQWWMSSNYSAYKACRRATLMFIKVHVHDRCGLKILEYLL